MKFGNKLERFGNKLEKFGNKLEKFGNLTWKIWKKIQKYWVEAGNQSLECVGWNTGMGKKLGLFITNIYEMI